jgi:YD repeat-containing protein
MFGLNWRSSYEEKVFVGGDSYIKYSNGSGEFWTFGFAGGWPWQYTLMAPLDGNASLTSDGTQWTLTFKNGEIRTFDWATGHLVSISDKNGNTTQLSYDSLNRLVTVTDAASRHLYFGYSGAGSLVVGVTSDFGVSLSYSYDAQSRLVQVTNPDLTIVSFQYDPNSRITAVLDGQGKILESHTYDPMGRGLSSSRAGGVDALTVAYQ